MFTVFYLHVVIKCEVQVTCTFSCFEQTELLRYFFYILDTGKTGLVEKVCEVNFQYVIILFLISDFHCRTR